MNQQTKNEVRIFRKFARICPYPIDLNSITKKNSPDCQNKKSPPDISCNLSDGSTMDFEVVQCIDNRIAQSTYDSLKLKRVFDDELGKFPQEKKDRFIANFKDALIHIALQTAVKWGLVSRNVADAVDPPKFKRSQMQTWNEYEVNQFLETAKESQYYALFYTALFTGMRRSELLALRWQDIDFIYSQIYVCRSLHHLKDGSYVFTQPKSERSRRTIALPPSAFLTLSEYREAKETESLLLGTTLKEDDLDIIIIITDHSMINYKVIVKNAKIVFDTRNVIKFKSKKVEKL